MRHLTPALFVALATETAQRWPSAELEKNAVGNLSVMVDGEWVAWLDLRTGEINVLGAEEDAVPVVIPTSSSPPTRPAH